VRQYTVGYPSLASCWFDTLPPRSAVVAQAPVAATTDSVGDRVTINLLDGSFIVLGQKRSF